MSGIIAAADTRDSNLRERERVGRREINLISRNTEQRKLLNCGREVIVGQRSQHGLWAGTRGEKLLLSSHNRRTVEGGREGGRLRLGSLRALPEPPVSGGLRRSLRVAIKCKFLQSGSNDSSHHHAALSFSSRTLQFTEETRRACSGNNVTRSASALVSAKKEKLKLTKFVQGFRELLANILWHSSSSSLYLAHFPGDVFP